MTGRSGLERIAAEHRAAVRELERRIAVTRAEAAARARDFREFLRLEREYVERMVREQDHLDNHERAELDRRAELKHRERERQQRAVDQHWADRTVYPTDWNGTDDDFPMPKTWLI